MIKLSVIIPVYNTERFLHKCLSSCVDQLEDEVEIIIVNDKSNEEINKNPTTNDIHIIMLIICLILSIGYLIYFIKNKKEN